MLILLATTVVSVAVVGYVEFQAGATELQSAVSKKLVLLRDAQRRAVVTLFADLTNSLAGFSRGMTVSDATKALTDGFDELWNTKITPEQQHEIVDYYRGFTKAMVEHTGDQLDARALLPLAAPQKYLQAHYTAPFPVQHGEKKPADAGDGSAWSAANARFNDYFAQIVSRNGYLDALLLDNRGNVVYSVNKGPDLGTNIMTGPYRESNLRDAYRKALASNAMDFVWITDYQPYQPHLNTPTAWLVSPVGMGGTIQGVLALPLPSAKINDIMTADRRWDAVATGQTTETYLAGPDDLMRSDSRVFVQDPAKYRREAIAAGTPAATADKALRLGSTTLVQPVASPGLRAAQGGQSGIIETSRDYLGNRELQAYAPLDVPNSDVHWSILATRDYSDAYAGIASFSRRVVLTTAAIVFLICLLAMLLARVFLRPVRRLQAATLQISAGDYNVTIPVKSHDEIGDLTHAFNEMSRSLQTKEQLLNAQRKQNDELLLSLMPEPVVRRYREGEPTIAQEHQNVSVAYAEVLGIDQMAIGLSGDELVAMIDDLFGQFDSAAEALGVERIRTMYNGYLAGCGITTPRLDSVHRTVEFVLEMQRIVDRFNTKTGRRLSLWAGVNAGHVVSGLVGRSGVVYDLWGAAVNVAYQLRRGSPQPGIYVTAKVYDTLRDTRRFTPAGSVAVGDSEQPIWQLSERP